MGVASHLGIKLADYDRTIRTLIPHYEDLLDAAAQAVDTLGPRRPTVVDLGTGTGALASRILRVRPRARVFGIDEDPGMLAMAHKRMSRRLFTQIGNFERCGEKHRGADPGGQRFGHACFAQPEAVLGDNAPVACRQQLEQRCGKVASTGCEMSDFASEIEALAIKQPS